MKTTLFLAFALLAPGIAWADQTDGIGCPPIDAKGHQLAHGQTGTLYLGDPSKNGSQAPDSDDGHTSVYRLPQGGAGYFLACHYAGASSGLVLPIPAPAKVCRQDASSFVCR